MCRIAAYLGPELDLNGFLRAAPHSLFRQSWAPREMLTATVNADGWGAAWLDADGRPAVYRHTHPVWSDRNVDALARSLHSRLWVGNVRSATAGLGTHDVNTQPFADQRLVFTHNGFVTDFAHTLRRRLREALAPELEADIEGNTDSEYLFALIRQQRTDPATALQRALAWTRERLEPEGIKALLNIIVTDGERVAASRAAVAADCPSLYWHAGHPGFGGGALVASEPFDDDPGWTELPPQHLIDLQPGVTPCPTPLSPAPTAPA